MSATIKSTPEAIQAIATMQSIIDGGLHEGITALSTAGDTAGEPNNWDGPAAQQFRDVWSQTKVSLGRLQADLRDLRERISQIQASIQAAGGAA